MILISALTWAVVTLSSSFMRAQPDYEAPLDNQLMMGALVQLTGETSRYWVKAAAEDYTGWITDNAAKPLSDSEKELYLKAPKWICVTEYSRVREAPAENAAPIADITMGDLVRQTGVSRAGWTQVMLPSGRLGWMLSHELMDFRLWAESRSGAACSSDTSVRPGSPDPQAVERQFCIREILSLACSFLGTPYMWGGNTIKYFDCSGLVKFCYFMNGILLPRNASQMQKCGTPITDGRYEPGDLLFFGASKPLKVTHVAMYLGDGRIVHSSKEVKIDMLEKYGREVVAATRILGDIDNGKGAITVLRSPYYFEQDGK